MGHPVIELKHLDNLWFQVTGMLCNIACTHCFNNSGPGVRTFGFLSLEQVAAELEHAVKKGVKEVFFTGGEPFLHPQLVPMLRLALASAPTTVLTNGTLIRESVAEALAEIERQSRYSLEIRISLDGYSREMNDAIRGPGVFRQVLAAVERLSRRGLLPLVTIVRTWREEEELAIVAAFMRTLQQAGYSRPRLKILPALPLGRELERRKAEELPATSHDQSMLTEEMLMGFDRDLLMCSNSRLVTGRGVWVCPLLPETPDAYLGENLGSSVGRYELRHAACVACYRYGTICGNVSAQIEGAAASEIAYQAAS